MPDNVKTALSVSIRRLLRPLVRIMLREGLTYSQFAAIAQMAFLESAAKDFAGSAKRNSLKSICALTGMSVDEVNTSLLEHERFEASALGESTKSYARVLHGWHNDRDYIGPYGVPVDLPFVGNPISFTLLVSRHASHLPPETILQELIRIGAVTQVGDNVWKPVKQEYIEPALTAGNLSRLASLVGSLLATLENNTRTEPENTDLFERTMIVDSPLTNRQLLELQSHLKVIGGQFLQRVDAFAAIDLREALPREPNEPADIRAGLQCFLYVEPPVDDMGLRDAIDFGR